MQFMPSTWATYGVDANGDGVADPDNPEDAIYAAARYLSAAGMPADTYGAIYAYNHADWYVSEVLADAGCYAAEVGDAAFTQAGLTPQIEVLRCDPAAGWRKQIPAEYLEAFESAAARYELGKRGVWALAAIARLESNFGRGMSKKQLEETGPLGPRSERVEAVTASTATTTATSTTPTSPTRPPPWPARSGRRARSKPASSPTTRPSGTCRRCSPRPKKSKAAARPPTSTGGSPRSPPKRPSPAPKR